MAQRQVIGAAIMCIGALLVAFHRPLGVLQVRSQPRWLHPWKNATGGASAIFLIIGIGAMAAGVLEIADVVGWLASVSR